MENRNLNNPQDIQIQGLLDRYLRSQTYEKNNILNEQHLDENSLAAFMDGNLSERESKPLVSHLIGCSYCRHVTAELLRLEMAFATEEVQSAAAENQPSKISEVLNNLLSRIFGSSDEAVFAHQEKEEDSEKTEVSKDYSK